MPSIPHPNDVNALTAAAAGAERAQNWQQAIGLYAELRQAAPQHETGWLGAARALRGAGRLDEADALLTEACERFPQRFTLAVEHATAVTQRGDEAEAIRRWNRVADEFSTNPAAHSGRLAALNRFRRFDVVDQLGPPAIERFPASLPLAAEYARSAEARRDWPEAERRWRQVHDRFADRPDGLLGTALALREQRRLDECEAVLQQGMQSFPNEWRLLEAAALLAQVRRDWPSAIAHWTALLARFPDNVAAHQGRVMALREAKRLDEAEAALAAAQSRLPPSVALLSEQARLAAARSDWDRARTAWQAVRDLTPHSPRPVAEIGEILLRQKRYDDAEQFLSGELDRFADSPEVASCHAKVATRKRLWSEAARRWAVLEKRFPDDPGVLTGYAEALWGLKDEAALVPVLDRLLAKQPDSVAAAILYGRLEMRRNRATDAVVRLTAAQAKWPHNTHIGATLNDARLQAMTEAADDAAVPAKAPAPAQNEPSAIPDNLFAQFESLGTGCEFGLLQRQFGAEPLGLLRWASVPPGSLTAMLERRFESVGAAANTKIRPEGANYALIDTLYQIEMQTFIATATESAETLLPKLCKRQRFLARQMIDRLTNADRIMVYKAAQRMTEPEIERLWRALRSYGDNTLLLVQLADDQHAPGRLEVCHDTLLLGYVDHFSNTNIAVDAWTEVCRAASETWAQARQHRLMLSSCNAWQ
jgi:tetratricopeptide (TPR) repeat protein